MSDTPGASKRAGYLFGLVAYTWWGLVPLYFHQIKHVPAAEILAHRIVWSIGLMLGLTAVLKTWPDLLRVLRSRRLVLTLALSAVLLATNWLIYIYATVSRRVAEASLGYFMMPLVNAALAVVFLGEKLRPAHYPALALVAASVAVPAVAGGYLPWMAVSVSVSFGLYSLVRKKAPVDSLTGLTVESLVLLVPSVAFLLSLAAAGGGHFGPDPGLNGWLIFSGVVTVVPLLTFTLSLRRLPLLAVSFLQFLSPTVQMLLAVAYLGESLDAARVAAFGCVWAAVVIFIADAVMQARKRREPRPPASRDRKGAAETSGRSLAVAARPVTR